MAQHRITTTNVEMSVNGQPARICSGNLWRETMDRRVQRTEDVLHQALISLMIEKGYEVITVQDIIDRANVGRSTFYTHYTGKQELLLRGLNNLSRNLLEQQRLVLGKKGSSRDRGFGFSIA